MAISFILVVLVLVVCAAYATENTTVASPVFDDLVISAHKELDAKMIMKVFKLLNRYYNQTAATGVHLSSIVQLSDPARRNMLCRVSYETPWLPVKSHTVILKQTAKAKSAADTSERLARDWTGLEFFNKVPALRGHVPLFYGGSRAFQFILMEDLGPNPVTLGIYLTNTSFADPDSAADAIRHFMKILGRMHAASYPGVRLFDEMLHDLDDKLPSWKAYVHNHYRKMRKYVNFTANSLQLAHPPALYTEIQHMTNRTMAPGLFTSVLHADLCPDNVVFSTASRRAYLFDFEWSETRSVFLDMTQLRMGMPGCWCSGMVPEAVLLDAEAVYRAELAKAIPEAKNDQKYYSAYIDACGFRAMKAFEIIKSLVKHDLDAAELTNDQRTRIAKSMRVAVSRLELFIEANEGHNFLPHVMNLVSATLHRLRSLWDTGAKSVPLFTVFDENTVQPTLNVEAHESDR